MVVVLGKAHCVPLGVNVSVIEPLCPDGSKLLPDTPNPLHAPLIPLCVVGKGIAESNEQRPVKDCRVTGNAVFTVISTVLDKRHCPASGIKISVIVPFCPLGSKLLLLTPAPLHVPVSPLCGVAKLIGGAISHIGDNGVSGTLVGAVTVIFMVLLLAHCPGLAVNVKVMLPLKPIGSNELPDTPLPLQTPVILLP